MRRLVPLIAGALLGTVCGAFAGGAADLLVTLVFPHGGWERVTREMLLNLAIGSTTGALLGGLAGIGLRTMWHRPRTGDGL